MASSSRHDSGEMCWYSHPDAPLIEEHRAGEQICSKRGLGDRVIVVGSKSRTFSNEKSGVNPSRVGGPESHLLNGSDSLTMVGPATGAASFDALGGAKYQNRSSMNSSARTVANSYREIMTMANRINISKANIDRALYFLKRLLDGKFVKGFSSDAIASVCLYIACCRERDRGILKELCAVSKISKKEICRCFKLILKEFERKSESIKSGDSMSGFCPSLGLKNSIRRAAPLIEDHRTGDQICCELSKLSI